MTIPALIISGIILAIIVGIFVYKTYIVPSSIYKTALAYAEDCDIMSAESELSSLEDPSDWIDNDKFIDALIAAISEVLDDNAQYSALLRLTDLCDSSDQEKLYYALGVAYSDIGETEKAIDFLEESDDYKDAEDLIDELEDFLENVQSVQNEQDYKVAIELFENEDYVAAKEKFDELEDYSDCADYSNVCSLIEYENQYADLFKLYEKEEYTDILDSIEDLIASVNSKYQNATDSFNDLCETLGMGNFEVLRADVYSVYITALIKDGEEDEVLSVAKEIGFVLESEEAEYSSSNYTFWHIVGYTDTDATYINLPTGISSIEDYTFSKCTKLEEVSTNVVYVDPLAFESTPWLNNMKDEIVVLDNGFLFLYPDATTTTGEIVIPDGVQYIDSEFFKNGVMDSVVFPDSLIGIFQGAFMDCDNLASVNIPEGVEFIYESTFYGCDMLSTVTLPSTLEWLETTAFSSCPELLEVTVNQNEGDLFVFGSPDDQTYTLKYLDTETEEE